MQRILYLTEAITIDWGTNWHYHICGVNSSSCWAGTDEKPSVKINLSKHAPFNPTIQTSTYSEQSLQPANTCPVFPPLTHTSKHKHMIYLSAAEFKVTAAAVSFHSSRVWGPTCRHPGQRQRRPPYVGKQIPQHSIQISRQSEDSQHASMMPQSMSQGQLQSSPKSSAQQQQQQASDVQAPHEACATTMLQSVRNSQNRQARMQWTQQSGSKCQNQSGWRVGRLKTTWKPQIYKIRCICNILMC